MKTPFDLIQRLSAWFLRADRDIALPSGRKITITGANVEITSGNLVITGGNVTVSGTVDGVDISAHASNASAHHNRQHALDSASDHTGTLPWASVSKTGSNLSDLATRAHSSLTGVGANDHHNQSHVLATTSALGGDHTVSGLSSGQVLRATGSTTARFEALQDSDIPSTIARDSEVTSAISTHSSSGDHDGRYYRENEFSSNPGAASSPLKSDSSGFLDLEGIGVGTYVSASERIAGSGNLLIGGRGNIGAGLEVGGTGSNPTAGRIVVAESSAPATPSSGTAVMYFKTDGRLYTKDDGGTEYGPL